MPKTLIKFGNIAKRSASINSASTININEYNSIEKNYKLVLNKVENKSSESNLRLNVNKVLESLADSNTADKYKYYPMSIIEKVDTINEQYADSITESFCSNIMPYIKDINMVIQSVDEYKFTDKQKERILREATLYSNCDRILNNHNTITKRFNTEATLLKNKGNINYAIESICSMIDTYNRDSYQKMNICLEEVFYLTDKNHLNISKTDIANIIVEYFLLSSPELTEKNYNGYKKAISESCFLNEEEIGNVKYIFNSNRAGEVGNSDDTVNNSHIRAYIQSYYTSSVRTKELLIETINNCMDSDILDINYNFGAVLDFLMMVYKSDNLISDTDLELAMASIDTKISARITELVNNAELTKDVLSQILLYLVSKVKEADSITATYPRVGELSNHLKNILGIIAPYYDILYDKSNVDTINDIENNPTEVELSEALVMKAHNLVVALRNLDKYLGDKCKEVVNKVIGNNKNEPSIRQKVNNILFNDNKEGTLEKAFKKGMENEKKVLKTVSNKVKGLILKQNESFNIYSYISEETYKFDLTVADIPYDEEQCQDVLTVMSNVCKEFNHILENEYSTSNLRLYYLANPGNASLHIADRRIYKLDEETLTKIKEANKPDLNQAIESLAEAEAKAEIFDTVFSTDIEDSLYSYFKDKEMNLEKFETVLEALSIIGISKPIVEKFAAKFNDYNYYVLTEDTAYEYESSKVEDLVDSYSIEEAATEEVKLEAYLVLDALLNEAYTDEDFEDDDEEDQDDYNLKKSAKADDNDGKLSDEEKNDLKKNPYKGLNLNQIKLSLLGLKSKFKDMSQKEKELSRNLDNAFKHLVEGFKNALISDSRESVIKGSVIPSFSRCLKIGIPVAIGIGAGIINPGVAAITALGSFAVSKHLTKKERLLLLDEIETELDVVEKEIQMADREEDMKKYRALLQYKKNLQRQYQRIRYNIKIGKNLLPGSNFGINGDHNNGY